ncbi:MAG: geranylgeranyl reductase family protein [Desulfovibrionaceae bacterium]|nr:geranylgeranyl reductase family protein [Desulfovibrionaceae bacterium]
MTDDNRYDAVIAGAGPAGAAAACVLARAGARVLLLDRAAFPRDKLCAGLLTWKTTDIVERLYGSGAATLLTQGILEHRADRYRIRHKAMTLACQDLFFPFYFASRRVLDAWFLDQARQAGATFRCGEAVAAADIDRGEVVTQDGARYQGRFLIGADGAASVVRRAFPVRRETFAANMGLGLECHVRHDDPDILAAHPDLREAFPTVYSGFVRTGYGWVFPHGGHVVVGLGGICPRQGGAMRREFAAFLDFLGLPGSHVERSKAHLLPYGNFLTRPGHGKALLAGDAAGLVETLFGEGIYYALRSGELAAQAVLAGLSGGDACESYMAGLRRDVLPELSGSLRLRQAIFFSLRFGPFPLWVLLRLGGQRLVEMAHGVRSYRWLRRRADGPGRAG